MKKIKIKKQNNNTSTEKSDKSGDDLWNIFDNVRLTMDKKCENEEEIKEIENNENENNESNGDNSDETDENKIESELGELNEKFLCYNCNEDALILDDGIIVCEKCGVDNGAIIDHQQEWRFYGSEDTKHSSDPTRCGMPVNPLLPESSLGTIIIGKGYDKLRKLNNWNLMSSYKERSLLKVFKNIQAKCDEQNITVCVTDRAKIMYKTLSEEAIKRGKSRKGLIAACLYNSCKDKNDIRSIKEISKMFGIKIKKMTSGCKQFNEMMYYHNNDYLANSKLVTPEDYIERYSNLLKIDKKYKEKINYVANMAYNLGLVRENTPSSIAVSSIYLVAQEYGLKISKKKIAEVCEISEVTISKAYKKMQKFKKFLISEDTL